MKSTVGILMAAVASLAVIDANAQNRYDDGASDTEIRLGHTSPQSGPASAWGGARGAGALGDAELLALLLRTGMVGKNVLQLAQEGGIGREGPGTLNPSS